MDERFAHRITMKHLRLVASIAEHKQLSLAAQALSLTQPAASRSLRELEGICGEPVFERHARGMGLTPMGELLNRRALNVLDEIQRAAEDVSGYGRGSGGPVRIGAVTGAAIGYVVPAIRELKAVAPRAEVHVEVAMSAELVRDLLAQRLDFVLARVPPDSDSSEFEILPARHEDVDVVAGIDHPAFGGPVSLAELVGFDWIMQGKGAPIRVAVETALLGQGAPLPDKITNTSSLLVTLAMLTGCHAVAPLSREVAELLAGSYKRLGVKPLVLRERIVVAPYSLITLRQRRLSPVAQRCRETLTSMLRRGAA